MTFLSRVTTRFNLSLTTGLAISLIAISHIPSRIQKGIFDRNAAPQFIVLLVMGAFACLILGFRKRIELPLFVAASLGLLLLSATISLLKSDSLIASAIGDTGRYAGFASLLALTALAILGSQLSESSIKDFFLGLSFGVVLVTILGFLQEVGITQLPTGGGVGSTLGNLDFLSAWIGTTTIILYLALGKNLWRRWIISAYLVISIFVLYHIDAKQGFLDFIIIANFLGGYQVYVRSPLPKFAPRVWKTFATFLLLLWSELIFLVPMARIQIPGIHDDPSVSIRADFWFSAAQMFLHNIFFGVGPDNYGNYYEKFRSLSSVKNTEFVLANDAHSSMLQTFATLGIISTLAFLVLILYAIYSGIDLYESSKDKQYLLLILGLFVFYTNSLISPITLPNKAIFWAIAGYLVGQKTILERNAGGRVISLKSYAPTALVGITLLTVLTLFAPSFATINKHIVASNAGKKVDYEVSRNLPCIIYASAQLHLVEKSRGDVGKAADEILWAHPRCLDALSYKANELLAQKKYPEARKYIYKLLDVAPGRQSVVRLAAIYAMGNNDEELKETLTSQGLKLGILTQSQLK
jgi:O-antigen ligase